MKNIGQRILAVLLCVVLCTSMLVVPASASVTVSAVIVGIGEAAGAWNSVKTALGIKDLNQIALQFNKDISGQSGSDYKFTRPSTAPGREFVEVSADVLFYLSQDWNETIYNNGVKDTKGNYSFFGVYVSEAKIDGVNYRVLKVSGISASKPNAEWYLCDGLGHIIRAPIDSVSVVAPQYRSFAQVSGAIDIQSKQSLDMLADKWDGKVVKENTHYYVKSGSKYLCSPDGNMYAALVENTSASQSDRGDNVTNVTETIYNNTDNSTTTNNYDQSTENNFSWEFDNENGIVVAPGGIAEIIDKVIYDTENKTYHIDSHDTYDNRTFYTFQYHINYTSITYIGQTEEYDKYYEVYYELPDGRNSADLTAQELEQLNITMDVIPYGRGTDNTSLRALYHFDGDVKDSSYWNYLSTFEWEQGASITYMDAGSFNGALYLDENDHKFSAYLPTNIASNDFTIQFRYYQSHTLAPSKDSYVGLGGNIVLRMDGQNLYVGNTKISTIPTGTWNEIAVMRRSGERFIYLNGVCLYRVGDVKSYTNRLVFNFGSDQQTYKYLDELRVLNYALAAGENYTPTSVPHDTNLTLVLPDSAVPVADEYWEIKSSKENLIKPEYANLWAYTEGVFQDSGASEEYGSSLPNGSSKVGRVVWRENAWPTWQYNPNALEIVSNGKSTKIRFVDDSWDALGWVEFTDNGYPLRTERSAICNSLFSDISLKEDDYYGSLDVFSKLTNFPYTFTVVNEDGEMSSVTFESLEDVCDDSFGYEFGLFTYTDLMDYEDEFLRYYFAQLAIIPISENPDGLVYMELVEGDSTDLTVEWVESVTIMDSDDLNNPTIAVRTDEEITSFQIGGVRPSLPQRGTVWALVESGYITSLQIYTGSAWEAVDGRIWTGERWIPYRSYNVITLQDMFDIVDATEDHEYIYTESGFYDWLQRALNKITDKLDQILTAIKGGSPDDIFPAVPDSDVTVNPDGEEVVTDKSWKFVDLLIVIKDGAWSVITGVVRTGFNGLEDLTNNLSYVGSFFDSYSGDDPLGLTSMYTYGGEDIWD